MGGEIKNTSSGGGLNVIIILLISHA